MGSTSSIFSDYYVVVPVAVAVLVAVLAWVAVEVVLNVLRRWKNRAPQFELLEDIREDRAVIAVDEIVQPIEREAFRSLDHLRVQARSSDEPANTPVRTSEGISEPLTTEAQLGMVTSRVARHCETARAVAELQSVASLELDVVEYKLGQMLNDIASYVDVSAWRDEPVGEAVTGDVAAADLAEPEMADVA